MLPRKLAFFVILIPTFAVSGVEPSRFIQPDATNPPQTPAWMKERITEVDQLIASEIRDLVALYQHIHTNPELSLYEVNTAKRLAAEMRKAGYDVTEKIGGTGIVCVLKNGPGPTVLIRTDMDALPITEQTGLPYASKVRAKNREGIEAGVMHACGHDIHMASWIGTARVLAALKDKWSGTVVFVGQPAEEIVAGARMMFDAGLYKKFPKPDYALALHSDPLSPVGSLAFSEGLALANADTVDIMVKGKGAHGAAPHASIDPIVLAARIILDLQTIVSRETDPLDPVVVTVGSIHGGTKHNIIPNEVKLQLTVRTTTNATRDRVLKAVDRIAKAAAVGANAPAPEVRVRLDEFTPATYNEVPLARKCAAVFREVVGAENVRSRKPVMGAEDFARFAEGKTPIFMYFIGTISKEKYDASKKPGASPLPGMHTDRYAPVPEPSIRTGIRTMSMAAMNLLGKKAK